VDRDGKGLCHVGDFVANRVASQATTWRTAPTWVAGALAPKGRRDGCVSRGTTNICATGASACGGQYRTTQSVASKELVPPWRDVQPRK
jgi:hypothetical protein